MIIDAIFLPTSLMAEDRPLRHPYVSDDFFFFFKANLAFSEQAIPKHFIL